MKALFLGRVAADTFNGIESQLPAALATEVLDDPIDRQRLPAAAAEADILVSNHWRADYGGAPRVRLVQSVATGVDLFDLAALPTGITVCNAFGHETAIAEYLVMTMLALHHRLFEISGEFRDRASWRTSWVEGGPPHGEVRGSTLGIVGYGRVGREVARRAAAFDCRILAANRTPRPAGNGVERVYPLADLDRMLPECDTIALCTALAAETTGLIGADRLALVKPTAYLINIARGQVVDEEALFAALRDRRIAGAALDVWWQYPNAAEPNRRGSHLPFHELSNVIVTPHNSGWTTGMVRRRWDEVAENLNRFARGEPLINIVTELRPPPKSSRGPAQLRDKKRGGLVRKGIKPIVGADIEPPRRRQQRLEMVKATHCLGASAAAEQWLAVIAAKPVQTVVALGADNPDDRVRTPIGGRDDRRARAIEIGAPRRRERWRFAAAHLQHR